MSLLDEMDLCKRNQHNYRLQRNNGKAPKTLWDWSDIEIITREESENFRVKIFTRDIRGRLSQVYCHGHKRSKCLVKKIVQVPCHRSGCRAKLMSVTFGTQCYYCPLDAITVLSKSDTKLILSEPVNIEQEEAPSDEEEGTLAPVGV